ncbi:MAG: aldo/keto reductase [Thermoplasmata archaeon]
MKSPIPPFRLNSGLEMPSLGLGMYGSPAGRVAENAVRYALDTGYRLFDTAKFYGNEHSVGKAIRESSLPRSDVFVTTKLWNTDHGYESTLRAFRASLQQLGLDYVDLYLIHWPVEGLRLESWRAMETLLDDDQCKAIGVSNYMVRHLEELLAHASMVPAVNQIELHPYNYLARLDTVEFCRAKGIQVEAYSPLTKGRKLRDARLLRIAEAYGKTPAQILLRWSHQHGFVAIPKSSRRERIRENGAIFDFSLSPEHMKELNSFSENLVTSWDPTDAP